MIWRLTAVWLLFHLFVITSNAQNETTLELPKYRSKSIDINAVSKLSTDPSLFGPEEENLNTFPTTATPNSTKLRVKRSPGIGVVLGIGNVLRVFEIGYIAREIYKEVVDSYFNPTQDPFEVLKNETRSHFDQLGTEINSGFSKILNKLGTTNQQMGNLDSDTNYYDEDVHFFQKRSVDDQTHSTLGDNLVKMQTEFGMLGHGVNHNYESSVRNIIQTNQQLSAIQDLISSGQLENAATFEVTQNLINEGRYENAVNFQNVYNVVKKGRQQMAQGFSLLAGIGILNFVGTFYSIYENNRRFDIVNEMLDRNYESSLAGRREAALYFNATVKLLDRNYESSLAGRREAALYFNATFDLLNATYAEIQKSTREVRGDISDLSEQMKERFDEIMEFIRQSNLEPIFSKLRTFFEYFQNERASIQDLDKNDLFDKLNEEDGPLQYFSNAGTPHQADNLHSLLNDIINQEASNPKNETDQLAFTALDFLCYGTKIYVEVMDFVLKGYAFMADKYYTERDLDNFNKYHSKFIIKFDNFHKSIGGNSTGMIDKVSKILEQVKVWPKMSKRAEQILDDFQEVKARLKNMSTLLPRKVPSKLDIMLKFDNSQLKTPIGKWKPEATVEYAMQFVENGVASQIGPWSKPYTIDEKAGPSFIIPSNHRSNTSTILIFRRFNERNPELVGILNPNEQTQQFRDIDRDLYNAAGMHNKNKAITFVETLLSNGANKSQRFENGECAVHAAARALNINVISKLIQNNTGIDELNSDDNTPLNLVLLSSYDDEHVYEAIQRLIEMKANVNVANNHSNFPLLIATKRNSSTLVKLLLQTPSIDPNQRYIKNMTTLHFAVQFGQKDVVEQLLNHSATNQNAQTAEKATPLHLAVIHGQIDIIKLLCASRKVNVNAKATENMTALHYSVLIGNPNITTILLNKCGAIDVNTRTTNGITPLHFASGTGNIEVFQQLFSRKDVDINAKTENGWSPLHFAIALRKNGTALKLLSKESIEINGQTNDTKLTPLHLASLNSLPDVVKRLFQRGAETNIRDRRNFTALHYASMFSDGYTLKKILTFDEEIDAVGEHGLTPLQVAVMHQNLKAVQCLLKQCSPANINSKTQTGKTALQLAATFNNASIVTELIKKGAEIDSMDNNNITALYLALKHESVDVVGLLRANGSHINVPYPQNNLTLLEIAMKNGDEIKILMTMEESNLTDEYRLNALQLATVYKIEDYLSDKLKESSTVNFKNTDLTDYLLKNFNEEGFKLLISKIEPNWRNENQESLLHIAAKLGYFNASGVLIKKNPKLVNAINKNSWTSLHKAAWNGHCRIVSLLLNNSADVNALSKFSGDSATTNPSVSSLYLAARAGYDQCVQILLDHGAKINHKTHEGFTALHEAARFNKYEVVKKLVEGGANTSIETNNRWNALELAAKTDTKNNELIYYLASKAEYPVHRAVSFNNMQVLNGLIGANVDVNTKNEDQETPLHIAARNGYTEVAKALIIKSPQLVNAIDKDHWYPLHKAAWKGHCNIVSLLLNNSADVNALSKFTDDSATTNPSVSSLYWAASAGYDQCVQILLNRGANINHKTHSGGTALHVAVWYGHYEIVKFLVQSGADRSIKANNGRTALDMAGGNTDSEKIIDCLNYKIC